MKQPTPLGLKVLTALDEAIRSWKEPTNQELAQAVGHCVGSVVSMTARLRREGYMTKTLGKKRTYGITREGRRALV